MFAETLNYPTRLSINSVLIRAIEITEFLPSGIWSAVTREDPNNGNDMPLLKIIIKDPARDNAAKTFSVAQYDNKLEIEGFLTSLAEYVKELIEKETEENNLTRLIDIAEQLGWKVTRDGSDYELEKYSPAGHDFIVTLDSASEGSASPAASLIDSLEEEIDTFDPSEEAALWLDTDGHGRNGAPYDMKDCYQDMECCLDMIKELRDEWKKQTELPF